MKPVLFDTSVIIDARDEDSPFNKWAKERIAEAVSSADGGAANTVVIAEACVRAETPEDVPVLLAQLRLQLLPLPMSAALPAAKAFAVYLDRLKAQGITPKSKMPLPDFFIGAHAQAEGLKLVTRDPKRVHTYFPGVKLVTP